jgi:hypothetical protein
MHTEVFQDVLLFGEHLGASFKLTFKTGGESICIFIKNSEKRVPFERNIFKTFGSFHFNLVLKNISV